MKRQMKKITIIVLLAVILLGAIGLTSCRAAGQGSETTGPANSIPEIL
jgi:hypothetical protein